ncbi:membrane protein [Streptomyces spiroverticillatus]|uniref:Membrane protein n=1 Tax=Streptomyces finlayi TaxID=67296 RepID=A0A918WYC5_9ACTN|nr:acyltransferase family protein [Streptomyces finlayi]GHA12057.1 membrane protein [Streptomyces spiroverticillatus]GHC94625.1 membrane protein [Streptomyces finlayi]
MSPTPQTQQRVPLPQVREPVPELVSPGGFGHRPAAKTAPGRPDKGNKGRDAYFDNAKYLAIVLVAVGHSWPLVLSGSRTTEALYMWVYVFHMPAFILISGYFSRSFDMKPRKLMRLVSSVVVPYVVFQTAYAVFFGVMEGERAPVRMLSPWFLMWFLMALFFWRLLTPLFMAVRWPVVLALLIAAAASAVPDIDQQLSAQRVLQFLPFFVLGLRLRPEHFRLVQRWKVRWAAVPVCVLSLVFLYWAAPRTQLDWVYRNHGAQEMDQPWWVGVLMTYAMFAAALVLTACFLAWVPRRRMWFTSLGAGTIGGYLLHGFVIRYAEYAGWAETYHLDTPAGRVVVTLCAVVLVTVLCTPVVRRVLKPVTEPDLGWAFQKTPEAGAR